MAEADGPLLGMYRAKVVDNQDPLLFGRVMVWIPDIMPLVDNKSGIWARPANNPIGGRNLEEGSDNHFLGTSYIPKSGSWVWIFFEAGNINRPYYFAALDLENAKVLPECQIGSSPSNKWVVFKSHDGRCIIISDDPDDARVEITGKKRSLSSPPSGDTNSVLTIDGNQTTILLDERDGKEKILIRTYKGDFINIGIDDSTLQAYFASDIQIKTDGSLFLTADSDIYLYSGGSIFQESVGDTNIKSNGKMNREALKDINDLTTTGNINSDALEGYIFDQSRKSSPAEPSIEATPEGDRDT